MTRAGLLVRAIHGLENRLVAISFLAMAFFPLVEIGSRLFGLVGLPGTTEYVQHLTLWIGFLGAVLATREDRHLSLHAGVDMLPSAVRPVVQVATKTVAVAVAGALAWASLEFVRAEYGFAAQIAGWLPQWIAILIMPVGFGLVTLRLIWHASERLGGRLMAALGLVLVAVIGFLGEAQAAAALFPGLLLLVATALLGGPIFVVIGGVALLLFFSDGIPAAAIPVEAYRIVASPTLPTIPLFTLAGYILAEGGASRRLVRLFQALFGWIPGGPAVATACVCAFFTTFTGASGVTILALGGLLLPVLLQSGFKKRFSIGLLTATGSLGLLFPPSLPVILYGVIAHTPINQLFMAGFLPGLLLLGVICLFGMHQGSIGGLQRTPFQWREALAALWQSKWEVALPVVVLFGIFGGYTTLVEAAAITVIYALIVETLIYRDLRIQGELLPVFVKCAILVGGILIILSVAMGLTNYLVDAQIPLRATDWVRANISSRLLFLLALNVFLLIVGCLMDIFSAIIVVVPLITPIAAAFHVNPLHLGIIFLANLELGYLTPPVGMNLFLASYRFERPLTQVYRDAVPFLGLLLGVVLLITYVPFLTLSVVAWWGSGG